MKSTLIKICGITQEKSLHIALDNGADMVGFIFAPESKRRISLEKAKQLGKVVHSRKKKIVAVFQDQPIEEVNAIAQELHADFVQLHGNESVEYCAQIHSSIIKTMKPTESTADVLNKFRTYQSYVKYFLLDRVQQGTGRVLSPSIVSPLAKEFKVLLAGGLTPDNIQEINSFAGDVVHGYDVASGVENP